MDISRAERQKQNWCNGGMSKNSDGDSNFEAFELDNPQRVFQKRIPEEACLRKLALFAIQI